MAAVERQADKPAREGRLLRAFCNLADGEKIKVPLLQGGNRLVEEFGGDVMRSQRLERIGTPPPGGFGP